MRDRSAAPSTGLAELGRTAIRAAQIAADRPELWAPGGLAAIAFLGWLPFLLAIVPLPSPGDLAFFGAGLVTSASFPVNVVLLAASAILVLIAASVLVASGEATLLRRIDRLLGRGEPLRSPDDEAARLWVVQVVAALPALAAAAATALGIAAVAPGEYQSPDIGGPLLVRIAAHVWPLLAVTVAFVVAGIAFGAGAQRAAIGPGGRPLAQALAAGARDLGRHPLRRIAMALTTLLILVAWLAATWALLRLLWAPLDRALADGHLLEAWMPLLLVGFVAIWLCLVTGGGALHGWAATWWSLELPDADVERPAGAEPRPPEMERPWS